MTYTLANGRQIDLDSSRLEERQRGARITLPARPSAWDFAPLLDVVLVEGDGARFRFTDLSAAQWLDALLEAGAIELHRARRWVQSRIESMLAQLRQLSRVPDNHYAATVAAPPCVSTLPSRIHALRLKRATVAQWTATIRGLTGKGVSADEIERSGVLDRLARMRPDKRPTDEEVIALVDATPVTPRLVEESRHAFVASAVWIPCCERIPRKEHRRRGLMGAGRDALHLIRFRHPSLGWSVVHSRYRDLVTDRSGWWVVLNETGTAVWQPVYGFETPSEAIGFAQERMAASFMPWARDSALNRWQAYSLAGGCEYRELLVQLHDWPGDFKGSHYRTRNVLAHLRTSLRSDADGRRLLYLDEIQSDCHAERQRGSAATGRDPAPIPFAKEWPLLVVKIMLWWAQRLGAEGLAWSSLELQCHRWQTPPRRLYEASLPDAAQIVSKTLGLKQGHTQISVRKGGLIVTAESKGWQVLAEDGRAITKPFLRQDQAETFAGLIRGYEFATVPVLWLDGLPRVQRIPLYGVGGLTTWTAVS